MVYIVSHQPSAPLQYKKKFLNLHIRREAKEKTIFKVGSILLKYAALALSIAIKAIESSVPATMEIGR